MRISYRRFYLSPQRVEAMEISREECQSLIDNIDEYRLLPMI